MEGTRPPAQRPNSAIGSLDTKLEMGNTFDYNPSVKKSESVNRKTKKSNPVNRKAKSNVFMRDLRKGINMYLNLHITFLKLIWFYEILLGICL